MTMTAPPQNLSGLSEQNVADLFTRRGAITYKDPLTGREVVSLTGGEILHGRPPSVDALACPHCGYQEFTTPIYEQDIHGRKISDKVVEDRAARISPRIYQCYHPDVEKIARLRQWVTEHPYHVACLRCRYTDYYELARAEKFEAIADAKTGTNTFAGWWMGVKDANGNWVEVAGAGKEDGKTLSERQTLSTIGSARATRRPSMNLRPAEIDLLLKSKGGREALLEWGVAVDRVIEVERRAENNRAKRDFSPMRMSQEELDAEEGPRVVAAVKAAQRTVEAMSVSDLRAWFKQMTGRMLDSKGFREREPLVQAVLALITARMERGERIPDFVPKAGRSDFEADPHTSNKYKSHKKRVYKEESCPVEGCGKTLNGGGALHGHLKFQHPGWRPEPPPVAPAPEAATNADPVV